MLSTKVLLNPFSAIFNKVHHPPPLDRRESQRLLNALTVSFRTHLDREHGFLSQEPPPATPYTTLKSSSSSSSSSSPAPAHHDTDRRPTDRHVRAILSNPLFSYEPTKPVPTTLPTERDPMDVFDQAVAKGLMNPHRATGVLIAKRQAIAQSSSASVNQGMASSGTAHRVVSWLRSSGLERDLSFVKHQPLLDQLLPFMVEEGLDEVVWRWLDAWMRTRGPDSTTAITKIRASPLLSALVRAKVSPGSPLDAGYATMIRAEDMFAADPGFASAAVGPWKTLSMLSTVFAWQRTPPSEALFDRFAAMSETLRVRLRSILIDRAHLDLHHPTHPDAAAAIDCLKSPMLDVLGRRLERRKGDAHGVQSAGSERGVVAARKVAKSVVLMATDATQHLTRTGKDTEAEWVGTLLLDKLGDFLRTELVSATPDLHLLERARWTG